jgi:hypothetical protein
MPINPQAVAIRAAALSYIQMGWPVFPVKHMQKTPATSHGFYDATTQENQIRRWFQETATHPYNIGIRTGSYGTDRGGGIYVLDVDPRNGGTASLARLKGKYGLDWLNTIHCNTGSGGQHYYYSDREPYSEKPSTLWKGQLAKGIDLKGTGGYVVAPPSIGPTGGLYSWQGAFERPDCTGVRNLEGKEIPRITEISSIPNTLWKILEHNGTKTNRKTPVASGEKTVQRNGSSRFLDSLAPAREGERNVRAASLCGLLWRQYNEPATVVEIMRKWNEKNSPPLTTYELEAVIKSVSRYHTQTHNLHAQE